jgi:hypothetical protein
VVKMDHILNLRSAERGTAERPAPAGVQSPDTRRPEGARGNIDRARRKEGCACS